MTGSRRLSEQERDLRNDTENLLGRPVFTHELALGMIQDEIREKSKADFLKICADKEVCLGLKKG